MKRGRREHGLKLLAGKQCILKLSVHKFHLPGTFQVLPGQCYEALTGFECCDVQAPGDKAARQLAASAPDLKDMITAPDPRDPARLVDEFVRISRTAAVVLSRDLIKNPAVTTCGRFWQPCHSLASVHARYRDRHVMVAAHRIRIMRTVLRRALGQAVREGIVSWNIAGVVECAAHQGEGRTLTVDQARQHRTKVTKGPGSRAARLAMAFKLIQSAPGSLAIGQRTPPGRPGPRRSRLQQRCPDRAPRAGRGMTPVALRPATPADSEFCFQLHKAAIGDYVTAIWERDEQA